MFELPTLGYKYDALVPHIDAKTMEIHHTKHHATYVQKLNDALVGTPEEGESLELLLGKISTLSMAVRNNAGGHYNHTLFWSILSGDGGGSAGGALLEKIRETFGSFDSFKEKFSLAAMGRFGSGWVWLIQKEDGSLAITSTPNQDNPLMDVTPGSRKRNTTSRARCMGARLLSPVSESKTRICRRFLVYCRLGTSIITI